VLQVDDMINRWQAVSAPDDCPAGLVLRWSTIATTAPVS
jgi:hypothetical protein